MKKIVLLLSSLFVSISYSQVRFSPIIKGGYDFGNGHVNNQSAGGDIILGVQLGEKWHLGIGGGFYWCELLMEDRETYKNEKSAILVNGKVVGTSVSLEKTGESKYRESESYAFFFNHASYSFIDKNISPFVSIDYGYTIMQSYSDFAEMYANLGWLIRPSVGVEFKIPRSCSVVLELSEKIHQADMPLADYNWFFQTSVGVGLSCTEIG